MANPDLPPNSSLVAIVLITKTRRGVKRVFHYPPNPGKDRPHAKLDHEDSSADESSSSSDEGYSSVEDDGPDGNQHIANGRNGAPEVDEPGSASPEKTNSGDPWGRPEEQKKESLLGLPYGFETLLCPPRSYHKKRFELSVDQLVFLGWPVYARPNGEWKKKHKPKATKEYARKMSTISEQDLARMSRRPSMQVDDLLGETTGHESADEERPDGMAEDETGKGMAEMPTLHEDYENEKEEPSTRPNLSMFHVVFVMNPPPLEYQLRMDDMYRHVVKKFSRALKWEQSRANYVQKECEKLKSLKAKHESASENAIRNSSLAKAIASLYTAISTSRIAHIELTNHLSFSLQIPIPTSIAHLPDLTSPQLPGVWLTTATSVPSNDDLHTTRSKLASHFALLLLSDLSSILADVSATSSPLAAPLANYLRHSTPRKSFLQISQSSGIPLGDIHFLASHLIYWRRARAVPPLHQRDTYIVSPNADMRKLRTATTQYARLFPTQLPNLPKMLALLSTGGPRPFNTLIPSKDHKPVYFDVLAWLMRGGWVTQLRSFAWVRVPAEIQASVAREEAEGEREARNGKYDSKGDDDDDDEDDDAGDPDLASGTLSPPHLMSGVSSPSSLSSARTAIPLQMRNSTGSLPPRASPSPGPEKGGAGGDDKDATSALLLDKGSAAAIEAFQPKLILQPTKASGVESRYLAHIARAMEVTEGREVREAWDKCVKYFNGEHALEKIAVREGWKRKRVEALRQTWSRLGVLVEVRHW